MNFIEVAVFRNEHDAKLAGSRLGAAGIPSSVSKDDCGGMEPHLQLTRSVRLLVPADRLQAARLLLSKRERPRCAWAWGHPLLLAYHDREWGVPSRRERHLFELLCLEGAQAGLSWLTILRKRAGYRRAFAGFDWKAVARFGPSKVEQLLRDPEIVRNRQKIEAVLANAVAFEAVREEFGSFRRYLETVLGALGPRPRHRRRGSSANVPSETPESRELSRALRSRGFRFVGPTTCYAFMQAVGLVNDHRVDCFRYREVQALGG